MLTQICQYLKNWFECDRIPGTFTVTGGELKSDTVGLSAVLQPGQYYRLTGSVFNAGVHKYGDEEDTLADEREFTGAVWPMAVPPAVINLAAEIAEWQAKYGGAGSANMSPYSAESYGGYSYTKAQGYASSGGGMLNNWQAVYAAQLAPWRKI